MDRKYNNKVEQAHIFKFQIFASNRKYKKKKIYIEKSLKIKCYALLKNGVLNYLTGLCKCNTSRKSLE